MSVCRIARTVQDRTFCKQLSKLKCLSSHSPLTELHGQCETGLSSARPCPFTELHRQRKTGQVNTYAPVHRIAQTVQDRASSSLQCPFTEFHIQCKTGHGDLLALVCRIARPVQNRARCCSGPLTELHRQCKTGPAYKCGTRFLLLHGAIGDPEPGTSAKYIGQVHHASSCHGQIYRPSRSPKAKSSAHAKCTLAVDRNTPTSIYYYARYILCVPVDVMIMHTHKYSMNRREMETSATMVRF